MLFLKYIYMTGVKKPYCVNEFGNSGLNKVNRFHYYRAAQSLYYIWYMWNYKRWISKHLSNLLDHGTLV